MTGDSVDCFNCGRTNPSWAQVCRSCGVPMRPGGAGARPPVGPLPTDRDSLLSIGVGLATIGLAIVFGLLLSGMLPEAASVIETPTPEPSPSALPSVSAQPSASAQPSVEATPELLGTLTFGLGLNQSTREVVDQTDAFTSDDSFCHSVAVRRPFRVEFIQEEVLRLADGGDLTVVQARRQSRLDVDADDRVAGFCAPSDVSGLVQDWGTGEFVLRVYRVRGGGPQLLAEGRFTLAE
jgi:hypothetical protein